MSSFRPLPSNSSPVLELEQLLAEADRRCHTLWTTEPTVGLERRDLLIRELTAVDAELAEIALKTVSRVDTPGVFGALRRHLADIDSRLTTLEQHWVPAAA